MKTLLFSCCFLLIFGASKVKGQDTLEVMQNVLKANYIGQPFSTLLNQLTIQLKYFFPAAGLPHNRFVEHSTSFSFYFPTGPGLINRTYPRLRIHWKVPVDRMTSLNLHRQFNGAWSDSVANHYRNAVIAAIRIEHGGRPDL